MLERHAVRELRRAGVTARAIAKQYGVSVRTVRRIVREPPVSNGADAAGRRARSIGRPSVAVALRERVAALVADDREVSPGVWNATLARVAIDYGFTIELCTPHQPQPRARWRIWSAPRSHPLSGRGTEFRVKR